MSIVALLVILIACAAMVSAGQFQGQGFAWADQICLQTFGVCHQPFLLGLSAGLISSIYFLGILIRRKD
jgi:hypothetical protein